MPFKPLRSAADIVTHLRIGDSREDDFLEFKADRPYSDGSDSANRAECALDIAQFANALGGAIVIGATEVNGVLAGFETAHEPEKLRSWIERVASGQLRPVPAFDLQEIVTPTGESVVIMNISPHRTLVARYHEKRYQFVVRVGTSKHYLEMDELEARMQGHERLMRFRLEQIPSTASVAVDANIRGEITHYDWHMMSVTEDVVRLSKDGVQLVVPLAYVEAAYRAEEPDAEWIIRLPCFIAKHRQTGRLHLMTAVPHGADPDHFISRPIPGS